MEFEVSLVFQGNFNVLSQIHHLFYNGTCPLKRAHINPHTGSWSMTPVRKYETSVQMSDTDFKNA